MCAYITVLFWNLPVTFVGWGVGPCWKATTNLNELPRKGLGNRWFFYLFTQLPTPLLRTQHWRGSERPGKCAHRHCKLFSYSPLYSFCYPQFIPPNCFTLPQISVVRTWVGEVWRRSGFPYDRKDQQKDATLSLDPLTSRTGATMLESDHNLKELPCKGLGNRGFLYPFTQLPTVLLFDHDGSQNGKIFNRELHSHGSQQC
jgi:hypothetical protein